LDSYNILLSRGATKRERTAGLQTNPTSLNGNLKNTDFVDTMI